MGNHLPSELVAAVKDARSVLFLGAGASRGATDSVGKSIPDGPELAKQLAAAFLGAGYENLDFRSAYDLSCSQRDVGTVQRWLFENLNKYQPANFHLTIPTFPWAGIATTNYDLVIERAYQRAHQPLQRLIPNVKDGDGATDQLGDRGLLYVKLHGCITRHQELSPPMLASTEQLIAFREGRIGQFDTFLEWAKRKTLIFAGYSFLDNNLRALFDEIVKEGDRRPKHFIVNKGVRPAEIGYWRDRRVEAIDATFEEFLRELDTEIVPTERTLAALSLVVRSKTPFSRFITASGRHESDDLRNYLSSFIEHVAPETEAGGGEAPRFYSGFDLGWFPIEAELDVRLPIVDEVIREHILPEPTPGRAQLVVIKGHAGSGKTVALRRVCYEAAKKHNRLCFLATQEHLIRADRFDEIFDLSNLPVFLFVDNAAEHRDGLRELIALAKRRNARLRIIATETFNTWNVACDDLDPLVIAAPEMRYLSEASIDALIGKLEKHGSLGYLQQLSREQRRHELKFVHGRQLLVALLEATHGVGLVDIISREYQSIHPPKAQLLYLDICSLNRFGLPVRAGLISRIHDISFEDFQEAFFKPLEAIVILRQDARSGDYVYEARHPFIAGTLYDSVLKSQDERFDNIVRILGKLNPGYSYDLEALANLVRAEKLERTLSDHSKIRQVYDAAEASVGRRPLVLHQRGLFEMHAGVNMGALQVAEDLIREAIEMETHNPSMKHSLAELDLKRSRLADSALERNAWRRSAVEQASLLISKGRSAYPHHTLLKAAIDDVRDALQVAEEDQSDAATSALGNAIATAEAVLKRGLQAFPNEAVLLGEEGELSKVLSQAERAETAFERAFSANPRSTLIARRLARIKRSKGLFDEASSVLRKALEHNPGAQDLHYDVAMSLMETSPTADRTYSNDLLYHLRRAFTPGDRNFQAQYWYARQLALAGKAGDARALFRKLAETGIPFKEKSEVRGVVLQADGSRQRFVGSVDAVKSDYAFIRCDALGMDVFCVTSELAEGLVDLLHVGATLSFHIGFSLRGPVAVDVDL